MSLEVICAPEDQPTIMEVLVMLGRSPDSGQFTTTVVHDVAELSAIVSMESKETESRVLLVSAALMRRLSSLIILDELLSRMNHGRKAFLGVVAPGSLDPGRD